MWLELVWSVVTDFLRHWFKRILTVEE